MAGFSRRKLMASGALAPALACRREAREAGAGVEAQAMGQSPERGHLLRSAELLGAPIDEELEAAVVIVGGGAAGWSAAWRLARLGVGDLLLFELEPAFGGTARSGALPRSAYPMGAHYLPSPPRECTELIELLADIELLVGREHDGTPEYQSTAICAAPQERHFFAGTWHPGLYPAAGQSPAEAEQVERFWDLLLELDRVRGPSGELCFRLPVRRSAAAMRGLDRQSMAQWMDEQGFDSWRLRWLVDYSCRDDYGCTLEQTSAFAALHHFLGRGLEETRRGQLLTWPGGNGQLLARIEARAQLGERARRDHLVYGLEPDRGELRIRDLRTGRSLLVRAQAILWAAPRFLLPHVLPRGRDPLPGDALSYAPWLVANLELDRAPGGVGAELAWDNVPVIEDPRARNLGYVLATHGEGRVRAHEPGAVLTFYEPWVASDSAGLAQQRARLLSASPAELGEHVLRSLERMHPAIRRHLRGLHVHRWGHAMIRPVPGLLFGDALARAREPIGRVHPCATDVGGLPLFEEAFYAALTAADWALGRLG